MVRGTSRRADVPWESTWDSEERKALALFRKAYVRPPRWADTDMLDKMGMSLEVSRLLDDMGLGQLQNFNYPAYAEPTIQFASTFKISYNAGNNVQRLSMQFRLFERVYKFSIVDVRQAYGLPGGTLEAYGKMPQVAQFWQTIASTAWLTQNAKSADIRHPVIRYVARLIALTFPGRMDERKVKVSELTMLYRGLSRYIGAGEEFGNDVNNAVVLMTTLLETIRRIKQKGGKHIGFAGFLTPLFIRLKIDLSQFTPIEGAKLIDMDYLIDKESIRGIDPSTGYVRHVFSLEEVDYMCQIPLSGWMSTDSRRNISFHLPPELFEEAPPKFSRTIPKPARKRAMQKGGRAWAPRSSTDEFDPLHEIGDAVRALGDSPSPPPSPQNAREARLQRRYERERSFKNLFIDAFEKTSKTLKEYMARTVELEKRVFCMEGPRVAEPSPRTPRDRPYGVRESDAQHGSWKGKDKVTHDRDTTSSEDRQPPLRRKNSALANVAGGTGNSTDSDD